MHPQQKVVIVEAIVSLTRSLAEDNLDTQHALINNAQLLLKGTLPTIS